MHQTSITLPVPHKPMNSKPQSSAEALKHASNATVLLIDDDDFVRETSAIMLEDFGFSVVTAFDGINGIDLFQEHQDIISLVLLDMTMPKMGGASCFAALHEIKSETPVILSSGYSEEETSSYFPDNSLAGFIQKPYFASDLEHIVRSTLRHTTAMNQL